VTLNVIHCGDALTVLQGLPDNVIQCCVTSPPYWGLRDYGNNDTGIGLEPTFDEYLARIVAVFREVRRVLRDDGTLWLNMGDSYAGGGNNAGNTKEISAKQGSNRGNRYEKKLVPHGLKPKDLIGQPWRVAFALQADGWYLRSDIIWHKPNPMPESVTDRPTKSHEYIFLMTKSARYYYNADAVREAPAQDYGRRPDDYNGRDFNWTKEKGGIRTTDKWSNPLGRNRRTVWTIPTAPFPQAHFATFPPKLVEPCIMAGTPPKCCGVCGAPWEAVVERKATNHKARQDRQDATGGAMTGGVGKNFPDVDRAITGYRPTCDHGDGSGRSIVLDPFMGSGTVALVAKELNRDYVGIEMNPEYIVMAEKRLTQEVLAL